VGRTVARLVEAVAPSGHVHEFLAGAAENMGAANIVAAGEVRACVAMTRFSRLYYLE
jgi:hypothetical protein